MSDSFAPLFDEWAKNYDAQVTKADKGFFNQYQRILSEMLRVSMELCPPPAKVLDIGIGTGNAAGLLVNKGYAVYGIDISSKMLDKCAEKFPSINLKRGDFLDIPFKDQTFDLIISGYALHHLMDNEKSKAISLFNDYLSPKGAVIIYDVMFYDDVELYKGQEALGDRYDYDEHYCIVTDLKTFFQDAGFTADVRRLTEYVWIASATRA
jgi:putative AdoMet-dependent methyltransferase